MRRKKHADDTDLVYGLSAMSLTKKRPKHTKPETLPGGYVAGEVVYSTCADKTDDGEPLILGARGVVRGISDRDKRKLRVTFFKGGTWSRATWQINRNRRLEFPPDYRSGDVVFHNPPARTPDEAMHQGAGVIKGLCGDDLSKLIVRWEPPDKDWYWSHESPEHLTPEGTDDDGPMIDGFYQIRVGRDERTWVLVQVDGRIVTTDTGRVMVIMQCRHQIRGALPVWFLDHDRKRWDLLIDDTDPVIPIIRIEWGPPSDRRTADWDPITVELFQERITSHEIYTRKLGLELNQVVYVLSSLTNKNDGRAIEVGDRGRVMGPSDSDSHRDTESQRVNVAMDLGGRWNIRGRKLWYSALEQEDGRTSNCEETHRMVENRFLTLRVLGSGSFGVVYAAFDIERRAPVALKLEWPRGGRKSIHDREIKILRHVSNSEAVPVLIAYGQTSEEFYVKHSDLKKKDKRRAQGDIPPGPYKFTCMAMEGRTLNEVFNERMTLSLRRDRLKLVIVNLLICIESIHKMGVVHRDIKPQNFIVGRDDPNRVYVIDFGLSKFYMKPVAGPDGKASPLGTGKHVECTQGHKPCGTCRYASLRCHQGEAQSRRDDLEAIGYMMLYLLNGSLPWQSLTPDEMKNKWKIVHDRKARIDLKDLCANALGMSDYLFYCRCLDHPEQPDYQYLREIVLSLWLNDEDEEAAMRAARGPPPPAPPGKRTPHRRHHNRPSSPDERESPDRIAQDCADEADGFEAGYNEEELAEDF